MKNILKYSLLAVLGFTMAAFTGCKKSELDTDQFNGFSLAAVAPNPVMRGAELRIVGAGLEKATAVQFAGNITVTDIQVVKSGTQSEIRVQVPLEGPEVGKVIVVGNDGREVSTKFDLTFSEPISVTSFAPEVVLSGDILTFKGEYLNDVKTVIFSGDVMVTMFESQSRHELSVKVPFSVLSGPVILSDVDEIMDQNTIPNHIYTEEELGVGTPEVDAFTKALTVKAGETVTVSGNHLDMIQKVSLPNADDVAFRVEDEGENLTFEMPAQAKSGKLTVYTFNGDVYEVGEIDAVVVTDLAIKSLAEDERFKASSEVEITGKDLDLVTKVEFSGGVESSFYYSEGSLFTQVPATAKDGSVTVTLESGVQANTPEIEVVKPDILAWEHFDEYVAGETSMIVEGLDLDLVTDVKMGDKEQGFIPCEYEITSDELGFPIVTVAIPTLAYTSPITFTSAAGYETQTDVLAVSYNEAVSITFDQETYALGRSISISGSNLMKIERIYIKGKKVTTYKLRTDTAMQFNLPDEIASPGVYRLDLVLTDGTELTWAVPFVVTAPFIETPIWEGSQIINGWSGVTFGDDRFIWETLGLKEGDVIKIYYTAPEEGWWDLQLVNGHWGNLSIDELGGGNEIKQDQGFPGGAQTFSFNVTPAIVNSLTEDVGWGGAFIINGDGKVEITAITLIQFGSTKTYLWQGDIGPTNWDGDIIATGVEGLDTLEPGMTMGFEFYVEEGAEVGQVEFMGTWWTQFPSLMNPDGSRHFWEFKPGETSLEFELAQADIDIMKQQGFLFCGNGGLHITGIYVL